MQTAAIPAAPSPAAAPDRPRRSRPPQDRAAARAAAPAPAPAPVRAPAPTPVAPAIVEEDDALIPMPEDDLLADGDDLGSDDLLEVEPEEITQSELGSVAAPPPQPVAAPEIARPADEIELSEADLAALDTSDLEPLAEGESLFDTSGADLTEADPEPRD